jgi:trk system potassium uptake protein TrkA
MHVIVVGCGRVGSSLATSLSLQGHDVAIVADDADSFRRLGSAFNGLTVRGLGFDEETLKQAGVESTDALAAVTSNDNDNLMVAEVAQRVFGVERVIARAYEPTRERTYMLLGIDAVCGTRLVTGHMLERLESTHGHHVLSLDDVELIRFRASEGITGLTVDDVQERYGLRICAVTRDGSSFVPTSDTVLDPGDTVTVALQEEMFGRLEALVEDGPCTSS